MELRAALAEEETFLPLLSVLLWWNRGKVQSRSPGSAVQRILDDRPEGMDMAREEKKMGLKD